MTDVFPAIEFDAVGKVYRRGVERSNLRSALPGRLGRSAPEDGYSALESVTFNVEPSEIVGVIGPNGAGKSTLLKLVARVIAPTRGRVITRGRVASLIELGVGFHPDLTGAENVRFSAAVLGMSRHEVARRYDEIVAFAGIEQFMGTPVKRYSSGMLARLGFAVASHLDAEIVLVDEVLSVGDAQFQRRGYERMQHLRNSGATLLFVTHNLLLVPTICQRALRLSSGRVVDEGDPRAVVDRYMTSVVSDDHGGQTGDSKDIRITGLHLSESAVRPGDALDIAVDLQVDRPMEDVRLTLVFASSAGMHAAGTDVEGSQGIMSRAGTWRLTGTIPSVDLVEDQYQVKLTVVQQVGDMPFTVDQAAGQLAVLGAADDPQYGVAHLRSAWQITEAPKVSSFPPSGSLDH